MNFATPRSNIGNELQMATEPDNETGELDVEKEEQDDPILIFSDENLKQLQRRTEELKTERSMQKNKFKYVKIFYASFKLFSVCLNLLHLHYVPFWHCAPFSLIPNLVLLRLFAICAPFSIRYLLTFIKQRFF